VEDLRVLGFRFDVSNGFASHVHYWAEQVLGMRQRIRAVERRYRSIGRLGA